MKILIVDDHPLIRDGIALALSFLDTENEILSARCCQEACAMAEENPGLDMILLDLELPDGDGFVCLERLRKIDDLTPVVIVSAHANPVNIRRAINAGARGFVPKCEGKEILLGALRLVLSGGVYIPSGAISLPAPCSSGSSLTPREREVLNLLGEGHSNKIIANKLGISEATVRQHATVIFRTLAVKNRTEAALKARDNLNRIAPIEDKVF